MARSKSKPRKPASQRSVLVKPNGGKLERLRSRLTPFEPLDLREIVKAAELSPGLTPEKVRARETGPQIQQVLQTLGFPDGEPIDWLKAFYALAEVFLGLGHVRYTPRRGNRAAAKWDEAEIVFWGMMIQLKEAGQNESQAIHTIASDPERWRRLPYKQSGWPRYGGEKEKSKREVALRQQWNRMKKRLGKDPLDSVFVRKVWPTSPLHRELLELELRPLIGKLFGDKQNG